MSENIGLFGPESIKAAGIAISRHEFDAGPGDAPPGQCIWEGLGHGREEMATVALSAAVFALDREALVERYEGILRGHGVRVSARTIVYGDAHRRYQTNIAREMVAAIFAAEGEPSDG